MALLGIYCTYQTEIKMLLDEITFKLPLLIFLYKVFKKNCAFFPILSNQLLALLSLKRSSKLSLQYALWRPKAVLVVRES